MKKWQKKKEVMGRGEMADLPDCRTLEQTRLERSTFWNNE
jgi:hypothetical protein